MQRVAIALDNITRHKQTTNFNHFCVLSPFPPANPAVGLHGRSRQPMAGGHGHVLLGRRRRLGRWRRRQRRRRRPLADIQLGAHGHAAADERRTGALRSRRITGPHHVPHHRHTSGCVFFLVCLFGCCLLWVAAQDDAVCIFILLLFFPPRPVPGFRSFPGSFVEKHFFGSVIGVDFFSMVYNAVFCLYFAYIVVLWIMFSTKKDRKPFISYCIFFLFARIFLRCKSQIKSTDPSD